MGWGEQPCSCTAQGCASALFCLGVSPVCLSLPRMAVDAPGASQAKAELTLWQPYISA